MSLTQDQVDLFRAFGFLVLRGLFDPSETREIQRQFDQLMRTSEPNYDGVSIGRGTAKACARLRQQLVADARIQDVAHNLVGEEYQFLSLACTLYGGDSPWHADSNIMMWPLRHLKVALYLDAIDGESGCLRVIPGTHRNTLRLLDPRWGQPPDLVLGIRNRDVVWDNPPWGLAPADVPHIPLATQPGDALIFPEDLLHCAFNSKQPRRQIAINFLELPRSEEQIFHAKGRNAWSGGTLLRPPKAFLESDDPSLRRMSAGLAALGFEPIDP